MQRQDYVLKLIEQLGAFFREIRGLKNAGRTDEALVSLVRMQESLIGKTAADFSALSVDQQFERLVAGEQPEHACEKAGAYAAVLRTISEVYRQRGQDALAHGAALFSDQVVMLAAERFPERIRETMNRLAELQGDD